MRMQGSELGAIDPCSPPDLRHLRRLTDGFGILQHTAREKPRLEFGYALDDVARALIVVLEAERLFRSLPGTPSLTDLQETYVAFLEYCQRPDGRFHNFVGEDRRFLDEAGSQDAFGRAVWALGVATAHPRLKERATALLKRALLSIPELQYPRSQAFALLGLARVLTEEDPLAVGEQAEASVRQLVDAFHRAASRDWQWFEDNLRYSNGALPYALLAAASNAELRTRNSELADQARSVGVRSLDFLRRVLPVDGIPAPIGNNGWYPKGGQRALYDQQAVDVAAMVVACTEGFQVTRAAAYRQDAFLWWNWFFGENTKQLPLYRAADGSVLDGLMEEGVNEDRGAESIVAFLLAHLALAEAFCGE